MGWRSQRVLVASDFSEESRAASDCAANLARRTGASLELAHVLDPRPVAALAHGELPDLRTSRAAHEAQRGRALQRLRDSVAGSGAPSCIFHVLEGDPAVELRKLREQLAPDLMVLGARAGLLRRAALGSVADALLRNPGCPLLLMNQAVPAGELKRILVGQEHASRPTPWLEIALGLAHDLRAELLLLHVLPPPGHVSDRRHVVLDPERVPAELEALVAQLDRTVPIEVRIEHGDPVDVIPRTARQSGVDLVAIGAERHTSGWPGAVAERCAAASLPGLLVAWPD